MFGIINIFPGLENVFDVFQVWLWYDGH